MRSPRWSCPRALTLPLPVLIRWEAQAFYIAGLKFLRKQISLLGLLLAFSFIFEQQRQFRGFLSTMTLRQDSAGRPGTGQSRWCSAVVVFALWCSSARFWLMHTGVLMTHFQKHLAGR